MIVLQSHGAPGPLSTVFGLLTTYPIVELSEDVDLLSNLMPP